MSVPQPQRLEKKENQHKSSRAHVQTFWSLLHGPESGTLRLIYFLDPPRGAVEGLLALLGPMDLVELRRFRDQADRGRGFLKERTSSSSKMSCFGLNNSQ